MSEERPNPSMKMAEFLANHPPGGAPVEILDPLEQTEASAQDVLAGRLPGPRDGFLHAPDLMLHCVTCDGVRVFEATRKHNASATHPERFAGPYLFPYACRNCRTSL